MSSSFLKFSGKKFNCTFLGNSEVYLGCKSQLVLGRFLLFYSVNRPLVGRIARDYCCILSVNVSLDGKNSLTRWLICNNCSCFESCPEFSFYSIGWIGKMTVIFYDSDVILESAHRAIIAFR